VVAALGDEILQFSAALGQSLDAVAGNQITPGDVLILETFNFQIVLSFNF
jgi:hypothetical protein